MIRKTILLQSVLFQLMLFLTIARRERKDSPSIEFMTKKFINIIKPELLIIWVALDHRVVYTIFDEFILNCDFSVYFKLRDF